MLGGNLPQKKSDRPTMLGDPDFAALVDTTESQ